MQSPVAAIRAAHPRASFVRQSGRSREPHLGLRGGALPRLVSAPRTARTGGRIDALRGPEVVPEAPRPRTSPLRWTPAFRWSGSLASTERGVVARRATPWRG